MSKAHMVKTTSKGKVLPATWRNWWAVLARDGTLIRRGLSHGEARDIASHTYGSRVDCGRCYKSA